MKALDRLSSHLETRLADLEKLKKQGHRIIGYTPGGFLPEELVLACGAIPLGLIRGGDHAMVELSAKYICRWIDTFCRAQIGYGVSGKDPYYKIIDLLVVPMTDNHIRAIMDVLDYNTDIEVFPFGVPHTKDELAINYYHHGIIKLKNKLEEFTQTEITESKLVEAIKLCNRERELFRQISEMRKSGDIVVSSRDFVALNHGSFLADKSIMIDILELYIQEVKNSAPLSNEAPRILLTGSTLARGDSKVTKIIEDSGGVVIMEEFAEGIRPYWNDVKLDGDLMDNLAESYFMDRICPGWFRPGTERLDFLIELAKDYKAAGLVWYQLMYRESYKVESYFFPEMLKEKTGLNMLVLESEYGYAENEPMKTRIETFINTIRS